MKKVLMLNGSYSELHYIEAAHKLGFYVITTGYDPDMIGHKYADKYIQADYSDYVRICQIAKEEKIDAICTCANDFGAITASYVSEKLGLPGHDSFETSLIIHHKDKFKTILRELDINAPVTEIFENENIALEWINTASYPLIIKPIDLTGGKGISRVDNNNEAVNAVKIAFTRSRAKRIVIEDFIDGEQRAILVQLINKKVVRRFHGIEFSNPNPFLISSNAGVGIDVPVIEDKYLVCAIENIADRLNIVDGALNFQYRIKNGQPYILDPMHRNLGNFYLTCASNATCIPWNEWSVAAEAGMDCSIYAKMEYKNGYSGFHNIMGHRNGRIKNIIVDNDLLEHSFFRHDEWNPGHEIADYMTDKLSILLFAYETKAELLETLQTIHNKVHIVYE
jgi:carbamoylphosphate synthase large subunit